MLLFKVGIVTIHRILIISLQRIKDTDEALALFERYDTLIENINSFKKKYFDDWTENIAKEIEEKSNNTILARQGSDLVLNFSPNVSIIL